MMQILPTSRSGSETALNPKALEYPQLKKRQFITGFQSLKSFWALRLVVLTDRNRILAPRQNRFKNSARLVGRRDCDHNLVKNRPKIWNFAGLPTPAFSANYNATIERLKLLHFQLLFCLTVFSDTR